MDVALRALAAELQRTLEREQVDAPDRRVPRLAAAPEVARLLAFPPGQAFTRRR